MKTTHCYFTTNDNVKLHYEETLCIHDDDDDDKNTTTTTTFVTIPGWSQTTVQFAAQVEAVVKNKNNANTKNNKIKRVIVLDPRGHGKSEKPNHGYRVSRMAQDIHNLLQHLSSSSSDDHKKKEKFHIMAHSAACAVVWNYIELFGQDTIQSLILIDQMSCCFKDPSWSVEECNRYGAIMTSLETKHIMEQMRLNDKIGNEMTRMFMKAMLSNELNEDKIQLLINESLQMPCSASSQLLWSVQSGDFRDILSLITVPTLCIGAKQSHIPKECMEWTSKQIANSTFHLLDGTHFMFYEHPDEFNQVLLNFLNEN